MNHIEEQNGPFCDVKRPILKNVTVFVPILIDYFTV